MFKNFKIFKNFENVNKKKMKISNISENLKISNNQKFKKFHIFQKF